MDNHLSGMLRELVLSWLHKVFEIEPTFYRMETVACPALTVMNLSHILMVKADDGDLGIGINCTPAFNFSLLPVPDLPYCWPTPLSARERSLCPLEMPAGMLCTPPNWVREALKLGRGKQVNHCRIAVILN